MGNIPAVQLNSFCIKLICNLGELALLKGHVQLSAHSSSWEDRHQTITRLRLPLTIKCKVCTDSTALPQHDLGVTKQSCRQTQYTPMVWSTSQTLSWDITPPDLVKKFLAMALETPTPILSKWNYTVGWRLIMHGKWVFVANAIKCIPLHSKL